ncbi:neprilysin-2-like [Rhipicephalus microplus]|uniref:neprilysin-2-like n=1 Tax=Rhipicephalus microplus TaxID=6941 RepID=UPI003F6CC05E
MLMFRACAYDTSSQRDASALLMLRQFMAQRGIPWPSKQSSLAVRPLGVLIDLAYKWQVPLWFSVRFARKSLKISIPPAVIIAPSSYTLVWFSLHRDIVRRGAFQNHWRRLYDALSDAPNASDSNAQRAQHTADVDSTVLGELAKALTNGSEPSDEGKLRNVSQQFTPNINYTEWRHQLQEHVLPIIDGNYLLRVYNSAVLRATDALFSRFTEDTLLENMGWFFARLFAPLADPSLLRDRYGAPHSGEEELPLFCAAQVEALFRLLVISLYTVPRFSPALRDDVDQLLDAIREMAVDKVSGLPWLDKRSKQRAEHKLRKAGTVLWPPDNMLSGEGLATVYSKVRQPSGTSWTVVDAWVQGREAINSLDKSEHDVVMHMPANMELPLVEYDYLRNEVRVSVQALSRPVFYFEGTRAMLYGGLGFLYAAEVVRALDADGALRDAYGVLVSNGSWLSPAWTEAVLDREECLPEPGGYFPEIPALEVAYASLEKSLVSSGERMRTAQSAFSERRLFYVTLCYLMCANQTLQPQRRPFAGDCNKAVANFPRFAEDFGCSADARMRRERPCVFFG